MWYIYIITSIPLSDFIVTFITEITGEIRLLQDQKVLQDEQTINDLQLTEKSQLSMVLEPALRMVSTH